MTARADARRARRGRRAVSRRREAVQRLRNASLRDRNDDRGTAPAHPRWRIEGALIREWRLAGRLTGCSLRPALTNGGGFDLAAGEKFAPGMIALVSPDGSAGRAADGIAFPN